ncbi:MAG: DUF3396 domain-containing protein [Mesorhizobium sp.]|uniref:type VI immunity family protein n=1 Tax=Mesorhizobium sp. TaxID=1871066 RepID=UPI000FE4DC5B|nr:type VI immunity family protein [Mesorhizobium sp.]RWP24100.1 MAG: DUF3396 domain-containing protein [Mesorhizobium sp.]
MTTDSEPRGTAPAFSNALLQSRVVDGTPLYKILLELVVYPTHLTVDDFDWIIDLYRSVCPTDRISHFKIAELPFWSPVADPVLTRSARLAASHRYVFFEAARKRIGEGRGLEAQLWDGREITDSGGTFNLNIQALKRRSQGLFWYVRFLFPLDFPAGKLVSILRTLADRLAVYSGHGGPVFAFARNKRNEAFTEIYAKAHRFWGVDIDMLDRTPLRMRSRLKSPCWLNLLGSPFREDTSVAARIEEFRTTPDIFIFDQRFGTVFVLGDAPDGLDRNRLASKVPLYQGMAKVMGGYILSGVDPLPGEGFQANGDATDEWLQRFSDGAGWLAPASLQ